jgi:hypothetical protein
MTDKRTRMQAKLETGDAIDVSKAPREGSYYVLAEVLDDTDYCDAQLGRWIWSIARREADGKILASLHGDLYQRPGYHCLWLR